jgi:hypothetical protein
MAHILGAGHKGFLVGLGRKGVKIRISKYEIRNKFEYQNSKCSKLETPVLKDQVLVIVSEWFETDASPGIRVSDLMQLPLAYLNCENLNARGSARKWKNIRLWANQWKERMEG